MKQMMTILLALVLGWGLAGAQKAATAKTTVFNADVHCQSCVDKIMGNVPVLGKGVKDVTVDLDRKQVTVVYDASKNNDENIAKGLAKLHVQAAVAQQPVQPSDTHCCVKPHAKPDSCSACQTGASQNTGSCCGGKRATPGTQSCPGDK